MDMVFWVMLLIFGMAALAEGYFTYISMKCAAADREYRQIILIPIRNTTHDTEMVLREAMKMMNASGAGCRAVICDLGADEEALEICRRFSADNSMFEICSQEDVQKLLHFL